MIAAQSGNFREHRGSRTKEKMGRSGNMRLAWLAGRMAAALTVIALFAALALHAETIQLEQRGGVYMLPVRINDAVTVPFVLDSGAAEIAIPSDVFSVLKRTGTIGQSDYLGTGVYGIANGATV